MEYGTKLLFLLTAFMLPVARAGSTQCAVPAGIDDGFKTYTGIDIGDTVTYRCRAGYVISNGSSTLTCDNTGSWNGTLPTCDDMDSFFTFTCDVNGTITATNPDPGTLIWTQAYNNESLQCNAVFSAGNVSIIITGCPLDKPIELVLSPYSDGIPTLLLDNVKFYNVTCMTIPLDGVNVMVTDNTWVRNLVSTSREPSRTPLVIINSDVGGLESELTGVTSPTDGRLTDVAINERFRWRLAASPIPYIIQPLNCTAFSGEIDEFGSKYYIDIIEMGCSLDISLVTDFEIEDIHTKNAVFADLFAFRFPESYDVEIVCSMKVCPPESSQCDFSCGDRKKRSLPFKTAFDVLTNVETEVDGSRYRRYDKDGASKSARLAFRVHGPPNVGLHYFRSCCLQLVSQWNLTLAFSFYVMVKTMLF